MQYEGICIGSGGMKGIIEAGALQEFFIRGQLINLVYFAGTSVGAVLIALLSIGVPPLDILTEICDPIFNHQFSQFNPLNILTHRGIFTTKFLKDKLIQAFISKIGFVPTFSDMKEKFNKHLLITSYCLSETDVKNRRTIFSPQSSPQMSVVDAVILSCSIPIVFEQMTYQNKIYVDGVFTSAYPIKFLHDYIGKDVPILGIRIIRQYSDITTLCGYLMELLYIPLHEDSEQIVLSNVDEFGLHDPRTIFANRQNENLSVRKNPAFIIGDFYMTTNQKISLFCSGCKQVRELLEKRSKKQGVSAFHDSVYSKANMKFHKNTKEKLA